MRNDIPKAVASIANVSLQEQGFNEVDSLFFSLIAYNEILLDNQSKLPCAFLNITVPNKEGASKREQKTIELWNQMRQTARYKDFEIVGYHHHVDKTEEKQFGAYIFRYFQVLYVVFRGTDSSVIGWKEDFNLAYLSSIPAQEEAASVVLHYAHCYPQDQIVLMGHSKGGNLAIYAASNVPFYMQRKITHIFALDSPGFPFHFYEKTRYETIQNRIFKYVPQSSIIGCLFENQTPVIAIQSYSFSLMQHDGFTWKIAQHRFVEERKVKDAVRKLDRSINLWIESLSPVERKKIIDTIYQFCNAIQLQEFGTFSDNLMFVKKNAHLFLPAFQSIDDETKKIFRTLFKNLWISIKQNLQITEG